MVKSAKTAEESLAEYILCLSENLARTHHANDRPLYVSLLSDAGVLLARLVSADAPSDIATHIARHERMRGQTFLAGPEHVAVGEAWRRFEASYATRTI